MNRETYSKATQKETYETSYYLSNYQNTHKQNTVNHLAQAVRGHWGVESNNWQLDVTFGEKIRSKQKKVIKR